MLHSKKNAAATQKTPLKKHIRNIFFMIVGSLIVCGGFSIFITPNNLLSGGIWGIAAIIRHYFDIFPLGVYVAILNVPLILWGWNKLALRFAIYTVFVILLQSALLLIIPAYLPVYTKDPLLACLFGGLLIGMGAGLVVKYHGSGGGTEIVGIILKSRFDISVGTVSLFSNAVIVICAACVFGFEPAMYTLVNLFVSSQVFTKVLEGLNRKRNMMIVSEIGQEIAQKLMRELGRGVTLVKGEGAYTHRNKDVLFCVVSRFELSLLKEIIFQVDPNAFVCINETYEVMGRFSSNASKKALLQRQALDEVASHIPVAEHAPANNLTYDE
ncbi:MAG: YitT family protein [Clostridiales bacterium]|nr:YitT family protein [Clostridiales bacterium]